MGFPGDKGRCQTGIAQLFEWGPVVLRPCCAFSPSDRSSTAGISVTGMEQCVCSACHLLMSKRDTTDLGMSVVIGSVSPLTCDLLRRMNTYAHVFFSHGLLSSLDRHFLSSPSSTEGRAWYSRRILFLLSPPPPSSPLTPTQ